MESFSIQTWRDRGYHKDDSYHPAAGRPKQHGLLPTPLDGPGTRYVDHSEQRNWPRSDNVQRWVVPFTSGSFFRPAHARIYYRWEAEDEKWPANYHSGQHAHQENGYVEVRTTLTCMETHRHSYSLPVRHWILALEMSFADI